MVIDGLIRNPAKKSGAGCGRSLVSRSGKPKRPDISIAKFGEGTREVGEAHITVRPKGQQNLWLGKGLYFREANMKDRTTYIDSNLLVSPSSGKTDEQVRVFQRKLYIRAKQDKGFKAYSLKDKMSLDYVLVEAYRRVKQNYSKGTGVDNVRFADIEKKGLHKFLTALQAELRTNTYQCSPVRQVEIPKEKKKVHILFDEGCTDSLF